MDVVNTRCAGLDVHQATVVATVRVPGATGGREHVTQTFGTMTPDLLALRDWLQAYGVTHVALESTGVYWKPVYYLLEGACELLLINMRDLKRVPGRKTDVRDSEWLAQLLECGLLRASFVPPPAIRELRDLTRYRKHQIAERTQEINRLHRMLQDAGVKLTSVVSDVMGVSGRAMVQALVAGATDPEAIAELARGRLRQKLPLLRRAIFATIASHSVLNAHSLRQKRTTVTIQKSKTLKKAVRLLSPITMSLMTCQLKSLKSASTRLPANSTSSSLLCI